MTQKNTHSLNLGEIRGCSVHIDAATNQRLKQYRVRYLEQNPGKPLPGVPQIIRWAVNQWLDGTK
ncbi:hypothetical protein [Citrobacter cronae]|uniref:hypothetical protein n=1 Tax=Citrobacter cronae TaxID=1748967 RepID=UPI001C0F537D|nr:hypothetical protein [Citrobacter cronae]MBU5386935.1 hypothetical protein [Citrobacter cronae]